MKDGSCMDKIPATLIPVEQCVKGRVYELFCRNLTYGVYADRGQFIGIRTKFGDRFLDSEYHQGNQRGEGPLARSGTVFRTRETDIYAPAELSLTISLGTIDDTTKRRIVWDRTIPNPNNPNFGTGWWKYEDTSEPAPSVADGCCAYMIENTALFSFLDALQIGVNDDG